MPLPVERLTKDSSHKDIQNAISESISLCMKEGKSQKQCAAMSYEMARKATGKKV